MKLPTSIPIGIHAAVEVLAAPLLIVAPFVLGFDYGAAAISITLGVLLIGLAMSIESNSGDRASVPLSAHAGLDKVLSSLTIAVGAALLLTGAPTAGIFMVGFGFAHLWLSVVTRYSRPLGA